LICLTTNTLDALPAEVLQLVNSQGNLFEFPNAGEATMKGYWKNFFQSDDWWEEFWVHYSNVWGGHVDEETGDNVRLHSAAALQKYCMRFRGKPQEASLYQNVLTFRPSSASTKDTHDVEIAAAQDPSTSTVTTGAEEQEQEQEQSVLRSIPLSRQGSHTFARQHNIPHHVASKLLNEHGREWTSASKALKAQQIKVFETNTFVHDFIIIRSTHEFWSIWQQSVEKNHGSKDFDVCLITVACSHCVLVVVRKMGAKSPRQFCP
jgi:hypothetical protein